MNEEIMRSTLPGGQSVVLVFGDITEERVDAIVNAANTHLAHGGGVAGAIVRKGGRSIQEESNRAAPVPVGHAAVTGAGKLPAKYVIHAVGPRWGEGDEDDKLAGAVSASLRLAAEKGCRTVSLPAISTGIFGFPPARAVGIILGEIRRAFEEGEAKGLDEVRVCVFDRETLEAFRSSGSFHLE